MSSIVTRGLGLGALAFTCAVISCGPAAQEAEADAGLGTTSQAVVGSPLPFAPEHFRAAATCPSCEVLHWARLTLPETKVVAASAKLRAPDGTFRAITIDGAGKASDETTLVKAERAATAAKYGKLRPELHAWASKAGPDDAVWVWIRMGVAQDFGRREDRDTPEGAKARATRGKAVDAARGAVRDLLSKMAPKAPMGEAGGPIVRARLTAAQVRQVALSGLVDELGTDNYPGSRSGAPWSSSSQWGPTLRLPEAHLLGLGSGATVCVKEDARPDEVPRLLIDLWANPSSTITSSHARVTTGLVRNRDTSPYTSVAPLARILSANWSTYAVDSVDAFCQSNGARTISYSHFVTGAEAGAAGGTDAQHDWLAKESPYILVVASAGNIDLSGNAYVRNRGFSGLVVGGIDDMGTADRTDDKLDGTSAWRNPTTLHNDYELPHVAAPSNGADSAGASLYGTSASTAMVAGIAALIDGRGPDLMSWPEGKRAVVLATATGHADQGILTQLPAGDGKIGAGVVDAHQASELAGSANAVSTAGGVTAEIGRMATTLTFASDFGGDGYLTKRWRTHVSTSGRLRVAMAWDSSASCSGGACTDVNDGDLDLHVYKKAAGDTTYTTTGALVCASSTYDSTHEICDLPVIAGEDYLIAIKKFSTSAT